MYGFRKTGMAVQCYNLTYYIKLVCSHNRPLVQDRVAKNSAATSVEVYSSVSFPMRPATRNQTVGQQCRTRASTKSADHSARARAGSEAVR